MNKAVELFKILSEENRVKMIMMLRDEEMSVTDIREQLDISQPTTSSHLKVLKKYGIVSSRRYGKKQLYKVEKDEIVGLIENTEKMWK